MFISCSALSLPALLCCSTCMDWSYVFLFPKFLSPLLAMSWFPNMFWWFLDNSQLVWVCLELCAKLISCFCLFYCFCFVSIRDVFRLNSFPDLPCFGLNDQRCFLDISRRGYVQLQGNAWFVLSTAQIPNLKEEAKLFRGRKCAYLHFRHVILRSSPSHSNLWRSTCHVLLRWSWYGPHAPKTNTLAFYNSAWGHAGVMTPVWVETSRHIFQ